MTLMQGDRPLTSMKGSECQRKEMPSAVLSERDRGIRLIRRPGFGRFPGPWFHGEFL